MKKFLLYTMCFSLMFFSGCTKPEPIEPDCDNIRMKGAIVFAKPDLEFVDVMDLHLTPTGEGFFNPSIVRHSALINEDVNYYRFKLVAEVGKMNVRAGNNILYQVQASHVKIVDNGNNGFAFVSYNRQYSPNVGALVVFKYTINSGEVNVEASPIAFHLRNAQINTIDIVGNRVYLAGASEEREFFKTPTDYRDPAFFMVLELNPDGSLKIQDPLFYTHLGSFQATSIRRWGDYIYITTGDGANNSNGGLFVYNATTFERVSFYRGEHARSVDVDESGVYLMQAEPIRITKLTHTGQFVEAVWTPGFDTQKNAKSDILLWDNFLFTALNDEGFRMLSKNDGNVIVSLDRPGPDPINEVTNSVGMNNDIKVNSEGGTTQSNLLLLANGSRGLYWYDVINGSNPSLFAPSRNTILENSSTNAVHSAGNIVFVAHGMEGLKVLYFELVNTDRETIRSFERYLAYVELWNDLYHSGEYKDDPIIGPILYEEGIHHYNALAAFYNNPNPQPYFHFDHNMRESHFDYWADRLEAGLVRVCELLGIDLDDFIRNHISNR